MPADGISVAAIPALVNVGFRALTTGYQLKAVPQQAQEYLATIKQVTDDVKNTRSLRRRRSGDLEASEKMWIDARILDTERALAGLEKLVEPARVDMDVSFGRVRLRNRVLWVMRDGPQAPANLARLATATQTLNTIVTMLSLKPKETKNDSDDYMPPPPAYETGEFLHRCRMSRREPQSCTPPAPPREEAQSPSERSQTEYAHVERQQNDYPEALNPFANLHELDGLRRDRASTAEPVQHEMIQLPAPDTYREYRAEPTAAQLFGIPERSPRPYSPPLQASTQDFAVPPQRRFRRAWYGPDDLYFGDVNAGGTAGRSGETSDAPPLPSTAGQSWLRHQASRAFPSTAMAI